jgi:signal transduction histidine kinase/ligand-binding sensor domain-containing protein/DNA-binding response OmpR family regulator
MTSFFRKHILVCFSLLALGLVGPVNAQPSYLRFRHLKQDDGLKNSSIHSICQDNNGFIWIGTEGGLFRYDGNHFKEFSHNPNDTNSLNSNVVFALYNEGKNLWIGTYRGLMKYNQVNNKFVDLDLSARYLPGQTIPVNAIVCSPDNDLWIGCQDIGIVIYNLIDNKFDDRKASWVNQYLKSKVINTILFDSKENCWIGTQNQGILKFIPGQNQPVYFDLDSYSKGKLKCNDIFKIFESSDGDIWVATRGGGVFRVFQGETVVNHFVHLEKDATSIGSNEIYDFWEDKQKNLWISTNGGGLNIYNPKTNSFERVKHQAYNKYSLLNDNIRELFEDQQGNVWIASFQAGMNIFINSPYQFNHYYYPPEEKSEYRSSTVLSFYADNHVIWVGTDGGGLKKIIRKTGKHITYLPRSDENSLPDRVITAICRDYQNNMWFGTYLGGLAKFDEEKEVFTLYTHQPDNNNSLSYNYITSILEDSRGNFWVGTNGGGLNLFDKSKEKFTHLLASGEDPENSLASNYVVVLQEDVNGDVWVGTYWGLSRLNIRSLNFQNFRYSKDNPGSLSNNVVLSLLLDSKEQLWVGTRMGLNLFDRENNTFTIFSENDGLAGSTINGILEDQQGNIWISTNNGLSKFNPDTKEVYNFYAEDGLQGNEFYHGACFKSQSNEFFFGGYNGFNAFFPDSIKENFYDPKVIFTGLRVSDIEIPVGMPIGGKRKILTNDIAETEKLNLQYRDKNISIYFTAIDFIEGAKSIFAYKLEGFDDTWKYTTFEHPFATYTNLSPGDYRFVVKAGKPEIIDKILKTTSIKIDIEPPLWLRWWAYIIYFLITASIIFYLWRISILRLKEKNQIKIEKLKREKVESITQARMSFYTNISHDIRTPLTLIIGPLEQLLAEGKSVAPFRKQLDIMLKNARRLLRLINQLLDFRKIEIQKMKLKAQKSDLVRFLRDIVYTFEEYAIEKHIQFQFKHIVNNCILWFDPDKLDKAIFNLLSNAFKFTPENGKIIVELRTNVKYTEKDGLEYIEITISDTGKGISTDEMENIFERFYQSEKDPSYQGWGLGLSLSKKYIELHHGKITVESIVNAGTVFKISLPMGDSHLSDQEMIAANEPGLNEYLHISADDYTSLKSSSLSKKGNNLNSFQVLIVEDNIDLRNYLVDELNSFFNCYEVNNGREGLEMAIDLMPDIVISDIMMPEMDGYDLCKELKENIITSHIPVILLTAKSEPLDRISGYASGADAYISKPFRLDQLVAQINSLLENRLRLKEKFGTLKDFTKKSSNNTADQKFINRISEVVLKNLSNSRFGVVELSHELGVSRVHLHRKMKAISDISPNEFMRKIRLKEAAGMLLNNEGTISEICSKTGFNSLTYFSSSFKKYYNLSPREFIEKGKRQ